jgi:chromosome segregation ATPase
VYKKDIVAIDELKKDRDSRLSDLRQQLEKMTAKFEQVHKEHAELAIRHQSLTELYRKQDEDYDSLNKNLTFANNLRQKTEEALRQTEKELRDLKDHFVEKD